jgi:hypothetical protein
MTSPTFAVSPLRLRIFSSEPAAGAGSSRVVFSDSITTMLSLAEMTSPSFFSHWPISTSVIDSPTDGTLSSICM